MKSLFSALLFFIVLPSFSQSIDEFRVSLDTETPFLFEVMHVDSQAISICYSNGPEATLVIQKVTTQGEVLNKASIHDKGYYRRYLGYFENELFIHVFFENRKDRNIYDVYSLNKSANRINKREISIDRKKRWQLFSNTNFTDKLLQIYIDDAKRKFVMISIDNDLNVTYQSIGFIELFARAGIFINPANRRFLKLARFNYTQEKHTYDITRLDWFHPVVSKEQSKYFTYNKKVTMIFDHLVYNRKGENALMGSVYLTYDSEKNKFDVFETMGAFDHNMETTQSFVFDNELFNLSLAYEASHESFDYYLSKVDLANNQVDTIASFNSKEIPSLFQDEVFARFNPYFAKINKNIKIWKLSNITERGVTVYTNANIRPYDDIYENRKLFSLIKTKDGYDILLGMMNKGRLFDNHAPLGETANMRVFRIGATPYSAELYYTVASMDHNFEFNDNRSGFYQAMLKLYQTTDLTHIRRFGHVLFNDHIYFSYLDKSTSEFVITPIDY